MHPSEIQHFFYFTLTNLLLYTARKSEVRKHSNSGRVSWTWILYHNLKFDSVLRSVSAAVLSLRFVLPSLPSRTSAPKAFREISKGGEGGMTLGEIGGLEEIFPNAQKGRKSGVLGAEKGLKIEVFL